jgi:cell division protease FtsH
LFCDTVEVDVTGWLTRLRDTLGDRAKRRSAATGGGKRTVVVLLIGLLVSLSAFALCLVYLFNAHPMGTTLTLDEVRQLAEGRQIATATVLDSDHLVVGRVGSAPLIGTRHLEPGGHYSFVLPSGGEAFQSMSDLFRTAGTRYRVDSQPDKQIVRSVATFLLPLVILANLFALLFFAGKKGGSAIGEVMTFGTIKKGKVGKSQAMISFEDVGGAEEAVAELREVRDYLANPGKYEALGASPPKGVLLFGPPGTGKTLLAKAVAGEAGVPFFSVAGAEFVESLVGVGAARVRDLFARVRAAAPAIVFIDELDAAGRKRGAGGGGGGSDEREQTLNQLLVEMDGFEVSSGLVVIGATNRPDILDPALMRPGRFDRHITIERPEYDGRLNILWIHARNKPLAPDVDLAQVAARTPGFTGADLANVVNEATLLAIRDGRVEVTGDDLEEAIQRVLNGPKRRGRVLTPEERHRVAVHEAGHVVVAAARGKIDDLERVSILSRGRATAMAHLNGDADAALHTRSALQARVISLMGGLAAERLVFGEESTGAEDDLQQATDLARDVVARYGMSDLAGPMRYLAHASQGFLDDRIPPADISDETQGLIDTTVRALLDTALRDAMADLEHNRTHLEALAERLVAEETLEGATLRELLSPVAGRRPARRVGNSRKRAESPLTAP